MSFAASMDLHSLYVFKNLMPTGTDIYTHMVASLKRGTVCEPYTRAGPAGWIKPEQLPVLHFRLWRQNVNDDVKEASVNECFQF